MHLTQVKQVGYQDYFRPTFEIFDIEPIIWIEKSRDLMISWTCVAYLMLNAMKTPHRGVLFQTQKEDKVIQLVQYAKCLYLRQPQSVKDAFPLAKPLDQQPSRSLHFASGSHIIGIPGGADQVRSYHPWDTFSMRLHSSWRLVSATTRLYPL
jgi:hypothetical protein